MPGWLCSACSLCATGNACAERVWRWQKGTFVCALPAAEQINVCATGSAGVKRVCRQRERRSAYVWLAVHGLRGCSAGGEHADRMSSWLEERSAPAGRELAADALCGVTTSSDPPEGVSQVDLVNERRGA